MVVWLQNQDADPGGVKKPQPVMKQYLYCDISVYSLYHWGAGDSWRGAFL